MHTRRMFSKRICALFLMAAILVSLLPAALADTTVTVIADTAAYSTPQASTAVKIGTIRKGKTVLLRAVSGNVAKIVAGGKVCYVNASALSSALEESAQTTPAPANPSVSGDKTATVVVSKLTVYKKASTSAESYGTVSKGKTVTVLATSGSWAAISVAGKTGYCAASGLSTYTGGGSSVVEAPAQPTPVPTTAPTETTAVYLVNGKCTAQTTRSLQMYKTASVTGGSYGAFRVGVELAVSAVSGQWAKIVYKGKTGYVLRDGLTPVESQTTPAPTQPTVTTENGMTHQAITTATLYQKPSTSSAALKKVKAGYQVAVMASSGGWYKVRVGNVNCYVLESQFMEIVPQTVKGLAISAQVKIYASASVSAGIYGTLLEGANIDVYAASSGWAKVLYNGHKGYILLSDLALGDQSYTPLKSGSTGTEVLALQKRLETLGYFDGVPGGNYGTITVAAIKRFQQEKGLNVTGIANNATQAALYASDAALCSIFSRTLAVGSTGEYVTRLQTRLLYKNYYSAAVDGSFSSNTQSAVQAFQKQVGLSVTGKADPATLKALFSPNCPMGTLSKPEGSNGTTSLEAPSCTSDNEDIELVIRYALAQLGKPYKYGTAGPNTFDCSGLTYYCFKKVGITLPRSAYDVGYSSSLGERIAYEDLKRGDIVCFNTISDSDLSDHVGIYLGEGKFIHAPHTGSDVIVADMSTGYHYRNFSWGRRVIK